MRKPVFWDFRPGLSQNGLYNHRIWLDTSNFGFRKKRDFTFYVAKMKALIRCAVTAQLICAYVITCFPNILTCMKIDSVVTIYSKLGWNYQKAKQPGMINAHVPVKNFLFSTPL